MMSRLPQTSTAVLTSAAAAPSRVRSPAWTTVSPSISPAVCSATSPSRSLISTFAPCTPSSSAVARPMPRADPVTIATFPSSTPMGQSSPQDSVRSRILPQPALAQADSAPTQRPSARPRGLTHPFGVCVPRPLRSMSWGRPTMAGRRPTPFAQTRMVKRTAAALEPSARGALRPAVSGLAGAGWGLAAAVTLILIAEHRMDGLPAFAVRAVVVLGLGAGLGSAVRRMRARIDVVDAVTRGLAALGEAVIVLEADSLRIVHASPTAARVFGHAVADLIGIDVRTLVGRADDRAQL